MTITAPYGSWESPITVDAITAGTVGLSPGAIDNGVHYWAESRASEKGRTSLWCEHPGGTRTELTPDHWVRTMVHEYGGGAWAVANGVVVFSTVPTHQCFTMIEKHTIPLTPEGGALRYADFTVLPERDLVLAIREDHRESDIDCNNTLVALSLRTGNPDGGMVLAEGADFYSSPRLHPDGRIAWVEWDHPNMPWDSTRLMLGQLSDGATAISDVHQIAGSATSAPCHPGWVGDELFFLDDRSGYWNFHALRGDDIVALHEEPVDYCHPAWAFGSDWVPLDYGQIACHPIIGGAARAGTFSDGSFTPWPTNAVSVALGTPEGSRIPVVEAGRDYPERLRVFDLDTGAWAEVRESTSIDIDHSYYSVAQQRAWRGEVGEVHAFYYPPTNPDYVAPEGELPPLKVLSHGGPTGLSTPQLRLDRQYWTSRGWAILDVNYSGSAGYGRAYRERLQGKWGVADVRDCADGARVMVDEGLADPERLAIEGGSAGGYTTLAALTSTDVFTAGNCLYGIGDLDVMARETHKFESRYLFGLLGGTPDEIPQVYRERSPIHHLDRLSCPMLIQQGADDRVVPPNQAKMMASAVRAKGLPVALLMYDGEGHGFRAAENIRASIEGALSFFGQVYGYQPPNVPVLPIENL